MNATAAAESRFMWCRAMERSTWGAAMLHTTFIQLPFMLSHCTACLRAGSMSESVPRLRGTGLRSVRRRVDSRFIPACAGNRTGLDSVMIS